MDVDAFDTDYRLSGKGKGKVYEVEYDSLSQGDIEQMMQADVENVSNIFGVDVSSDRIHLLMTASSSHAIM